MVDLTIAYYPMDLLPPALFQIFCLSRISPAYKFHVHVRKYDLDALPLESDELSKWLMDRWSEKDKLLETLKRDWNEEIRRL
jgi:Acyltransferase C-terminus